MEFGHHDLNCRATFPFMYVYGDSPSIVFHGYAVIYMNRYLNSVTVSRKRFIDTIVNEFLNKAVKSLRRGISNVHRRSFPDGD